MHRLKSVLESLLFVSDKPLPLKTLCELVGDVGALGDDASSVGPGGLWSGPDVLGAPGDVLDASAEVPPHPAEAPAVRPGPTDRERVAAALESLHADYATRGIRLSEVAGGWQFHSSPESAAWVGKQLSVKPVRLSRAALETLAIVAYRQPI